MDGRLLARQRAPREAVRLAIREAIAIVWLIGPMIISALLVGAAVRAVPGVDAWGWARWIVLSPVLYFAWLLLFLGLSAFLCYRVGRRFPKPRYAVMPFRQPLAYRQFAMLQALPLVQVVSQTAWLRSLFLHAYSPSVHIGRRVINLGYLYDPDLTHIEDDVVIGARAAIVAHTVVNRQNGDLVLASAPITLRRRSTIGGEARVALGCEIGEDAVIEPGAVVDPFTRVPAGEVWGGNPARFRRKRDAADVRDRRGEHRAEPAAVPAGDREALRALAIEALSLPRDTPADELSSERCAAWDSLGQVAIASAMYSRFGIRVPADAIYRLKNLGDLEALLSTAGRQQTPSAPDTLLSPDLLPLMDVDEATRLLAARGPLGGESTPIAVAVAASFTAEPLASALKLWGRAFGFEIACHFAPYGQIVQTLLDPHSCFSSNRGGVNAVVARLEDLAGSDGDAAARLADCLSAIERYAAETRDGQLLVATLPPVVSSFSTIARRSADTLRHEWRERLSAVGGVELLDFDEVVERIGVEAARSSDAEVLSRAPYTPRVYQALAAAIVRRIRARRTAPVKVVAVDCDNTLWGGVVGEDGLDGIALGADGAGRSFRLFQEQLARLKARGILLAVVSRNDERDVREVFERHPDMVLRSEDIAAWRVNWSDKSENLRSLASELGLGLDAFVFLDDDPAVRAEVASRVPEVRVIPMPADPTRYCETIERLWVFDGAAPTDVDRSRTRMMQDEAARKREQMAAGTLTDYLAGLQLQVEVASARETELPRVAQLTQRTNQFNVSLKRRTLDEVRLLARSAELLVLHARDRFGEYGLVGACALRVDDRPGVAEIDSLLMSCRALGRGIEDAFLHAIARVAVGSGATTLECAFVGGPRNGIAKAFLARHGFNETAPDIWRLPLVDLPPLPEHVNFDMSAVNSRART